MQSALAIDANAVLTVPSTSTFRTLMGRAGTGGSGVSGLPLSGGTLTGILTLASDQFSLQAATKQYVDANATLVADGGNFDTGYSLVSASSTFDGGSFD